MDFDEYEYLEKTVDDPPPPATARSDKDRRSSRGDGERLSRSEDQNGGGRSDRDVRERSTSRRDRDRRSSYEREQSKDRDRRRSYEREHSKDRDRRSSYEREHSKDRDRRSRDRDYLEDRDRDRERSRRSSSRSSRHEREAELEREETRRRERRAKERELEMELMERERRGFKEKRESVEPEADPERDQRTVFAYQMPLKATERDVYEFFSQAGKVRDVRLIMDRNSRRSKGVGYIEFYDSMSVPQAIALSGHLLLGQPVMVKPSEAEKNLVQSTTTGASGVAGAATDRKLYVGNLHYNMSEIHLRQIFEAFGPVELVQLPLDPETGHCKGYGFIQFIEVEHAKAARSLNGTLDIAGRTLKVSSVTDHYAVQNSGTNAADFDDEDGGGLSLNARSRAILMQKLDRTGTASSVAESLGMTGFNGTVVSQPAPVLPLNGLPTVPANLYAQHLSINDPSGEPSECLLFRDMFDPTTENNPEFDLDIKEEVEEECTKFGTVKHIFVDKNSNGVVYVQFDTVSAAASCQRAMDKRWYAGRSISVTFMPPHQYEVRFRNV